MTRLLIAVAGAAALGTGAYVAHRPHVAHHLGAASAAEPGAPVTVSIQGDGDPEVDAWWSNPHTRRFYEAAVAALADGAENVDRAAFQETMEGIARDFAASMGVDPDMMADHLELIPGQIIDIAAEDPSILDSFEDFKRALHGPE